MDDTSRRIDLALAETLITQKDSYSKEEYQKYKYELLQCIIGESVIGKNDKQNFHYFTRSYRARKNIIDLGQDGLIIELLKNAIKYDAYVRENAWCRLQNVGNIGYNTKRIDSKSIVPFIVEEVKLGNAEILISAMKRNKNLSESAIISFVETRYGSGLFNKGIDEVYLKYDENRMMVEELEEMKKTSAKKSSK